LLKGAQLRSGLMGEAVADTDGEFFESEHSGRKGGRDDTSLGHVEWLGNGGD
jgi:hypothetical protein